MEFITTLLGHVNYWTITFLMLLESTVVPVPSELVVAPAAYHAASGNMDVWLVILCATIGADMGASINYGVAYFLGRPIIYRFVRSKLGRMCLLTEEKMKKSEDYFNNHGVVATLTGRLLPGIRHLISIPAGLAKMHYGKFLLFTTVGAGAWNCILAALGWYLHSVVPEDQLNDKITEYSEYIKIFLIGAVVIAAAYFIVRSIKAKSKK